MMMMMMMMIDIYGHFCAHGILNRPEIMIWMLLQTDESTDVWYTQFILMLVSMGELLHKMILLVIFH